MEKWKGDGSEVKVWIVKACQGYVIRRQAMEAKVCRIRVCMYIYIYMCSWCILPGLKVEHIITHLDRYGVDCNKKQRENQMSQHQVKRRQDILHVSQVFCWAPPLISKLQSSHAGGRNSMKEYQISQKQRHAMVFGVQLFPC